MNRPPLSAHGPHTKSWANQTSYQVDDVVRLLRGAFRAERLNQHGGWHLSVVRTKSVKHPVKVEVDSVRCHALERKKGMSAPVEGNRRFFRYDIRICLPISDKHLAGDSLAPALINQLAGQLMCALNHPTDMPWWQMNTLWVEGLPLRRKPVAPKQTMVERVQARDDHARKMLARAKDDADRALARVDKWQAKVTYYDKRRLAFLIGEER